MEALVLNGTKKLDVQDVKEPSLANDEVLIHTAYAGICGTDHALYAGLPGSADAVPPIVLGHENSGVIAKVGAAVTDFKVGDRVTVDPNIYCGKCRYCRTGRPELCDHLSAVGVTRDGGFEDYFTAPTEVVYHVPDNVSLKAAAVTEPISCAVHGVKLLKLTPYQKALVIGDGFMGQIFVQLLQAYGVHQVDLAGRSAEKLQNNKDNFGATRTFKMPEEKIPADYDVVIEAVGLPETQEQAIEATVKGAQVLMFGVGKPNQHFSMNTYEVFQKQLTVQGSFINPNAFEDSLALLAADKLDVLSLISHELDFNTVEDYLTGKLGTVSKAIVKVSEEA
ncbi:zinc-dependent alcohol dehydrogenase family protein [Periweissella beninensis]|uniref:Zinc-dependent alcohol dehydrogenase family protein n=1 Tax=Periweissella beninensis TaxID=504936 RepID=A0ABT0VL27_9LACO|nr:zinc-dependent alcohol dehydrogenase family protein [Periweissella beninensis]MBM7543893.1 2-desacetyl-2-hydroxyethyl bacteriochlorophyllide A dehydrogenase [Periweissella beninensis]MCM2437619.1 zinc-dependent alcohol dehydrogenase family protein [Periweissella beninensis]MCT4396185.1 alcohol dehydrogenase [Periweissella beninensis]